MEGGGGGGGGGGVSMHTEMNCCPLRIQYLNIVLEVQCNCPFDVSARLFISVSL